MPRRWRNRKRSHTVRSALYTRMEPFPGPDLGEAEIERLRGKMEEADGRSFGQEIPPAGPDGEVYLWRLPGARP